MYTGLAFEPDHASSGTHYKLREKPKLVGAPKVIINQYHRVIIY